MASTDCSKAEQGGVTSWPELVQYLLRSYAARQALMNVLSSLRDVKQGRAEDGRNLGDRVSKQFRTCKGVKYTEGCICTYIQGLVPSIRP